MGPLHGVRVLDLSRLLPGGFCTMVLGDLGADVIKVEEPGKGDYARWMGPFKGELSASFVGINRNKRSITLNLKHADGPEVLKRLAAGADVLVESFRPGVMDRLGVGFDALAGANPRIVYCAISGYGQDGPYRTRAGHDINYLGFAGVLDIIGLPGGPPVLPGVQIADVGGGALMAAVGILTALVERQTTGRGRFVDVSMMDGAMSWLSVHAQAYFFDGALPERGKMRLAYGMACYRPYRCADDRYVTVGALEPQFWSALCEALGVPEFIPRQLAPPQDQREMSARLEEIFAGKTRDAWVRDLADLDACVGPVNDFGEAFSDPQALAREMVVEMDTPEGRIRTVGNPIRVGDRTDYRGPPGFGEHTEAVLAEAGFDPREIAGLRDDGVV
jgi:crotonobetainyl-CoA:carnitine CoA-transferase CaiB-like acyl-CoA transferase